MVVNRSCSYYCRGCGDAAEWMEKLAAKTIPNGGRGNSMVRVGRCRVGVEAQLRGAAIEGGDSADQHSRLGLTRLPVRAVMRVLFALRSASRRCSASPLHRAAITPQTLRDARRSRAADCHRCECRCSVTSSRGSPAFPPAFRSFATR